MTTYSVNFEHMQHVGNEMDSITRQIHQTLTDLDTHARQSLANWTADSQEAYHRAKTKWDAAAAHMHEQSRAARLALGQIHEHYHNGERTGVNIWDGN
ncbi:WXG100 family type VII secretion target [Streptomyces sp. NPDC101152]|uniref:WXG100 family type VII secretion target n=1 Tax=Streptomyces sp. NPDC101152 TaxID=3366116 RepID=UPI00381E8031